MTTLDISTAVAKAKAQLTGLLEAEAISQIALERAHQDATDHTWLVTFSFVRSWDTPKNPLFSGLERRSRKTVVLDHAGTLIAIQEPKMLENVE